jgi:hypothetical protein
MITRLRVDSESERLQGGKEDKYAKFNGPACSMFESSVDWLLINDFETTVPTVELF